MFGSSVPPVTGSRTYLRYVCLFAHSGVQHIMCCVFIMCVFVLCLVYPMLPSSLECPFLITPSVFSNVYLRCMDVKRCSVHLYPHLFSRVFMFMLSYLYLFTHIYINLTALKSNSNTVWFNFQTYIIFSINLVSFKVTLRSSGTDILYGCHLLLDVCIIYFISCDCIVNNSSLSYPIY